MWQSSEEVEIANGPNTFCFTSQTMNASQSFTFGVWTISSESNHILPSLCSTPVCCLPNKEQSSEMKNICNFCRYEKELALPKFPDMTFADNRLEIKHTRGFGISFSCLDALKEVDNPKKLTEIAVATAWKEARDDCEHVKEVVKPFDWTFTTSYKGTFLGDPKFQVTPTNEQINMEKLKVKEEILFYDDVCLFEDELADNGIAQCSVKIRVMKSGFFVLLRYFLRVDNVVAKIHDTRLYHEAGQDFILREFCSRESTLSDLQVPNAILINPAELSQHLAIKERNTDILKFPDLHLP